MATIGKKDYVYQLLDILERLEAIKKVGAFYSLNTPSELGVSIYLAIKGNILFITNNEDLIMNRLSSGYDKKERLSRAQQKMLGSSPFTMYWNIEKTLKQLNADGPGIFKSGTIAEGSTLASAYLKSLSATGWKVKNNTVESHMTLQLQDESTNSLLAGLKFINQLFLKKMSKEDKN